MGRGGGGMGKSWHHAGTGSNKINSMHDLIACSKFLTSEGYVHNNRLCAVGLSAGGLLAGAVINLCPDLFCAAILKVIISWRTPFWLYFVIQKKKKIALSFWLYPYWDAAYYL